MSARAGPDGSEEFQEFLWSLLDDSNRRRLAEFDDCSAAVLDLAAMVHLSAAAYAINELCAELQEPRRGFDALLDELEEKGTLPPKIPFFEGYAGAGIAVASLSSYTGFADASALETRKTASRLLIQRLAFLGSASFTRSS
jgi:hypothetical protein